MIIFLNLTLIILFLIKGVFFKNEFSLFKSTFYKFINFFKNFLFIFKSKELSFNTISKFFNGFKLKSSVNFLFKYYIYILYMISKLNSKFFLLSSFLKLNQKIKSKIKANNIDTHLNTFLKNNPLKIDSMFEKSFNSDYLVKYKPSSFVKFFENNNNINILFLRKNKIFNKGRYSRNRQLYRTGVYWCIWLSVFLGYCLYFSFYRFTFNFGYQWWLIFSFFFLFVNQKMFKYNFYNLRVVALELNKNFNWFSFFAQNFFFKIKKYLNS